MKDFQLRLKSISWKVILVTMMITMAMDQVSKLMILQYFQRGEILEVIPGLFNLTLHFNKGAAFGLFSGMEDGYRQLVMGLLSKLAIIMLLFFLIYESYESRRAQFCIGLILGGAVGNIIDRVYRGEVVDFLDFFIKDYHWPAFNVADSCICVGVMILLFFESRGKNTQEHQAASPA